MSRALKTVGQIAGTIAIVAGTIAAFSNPATATFAVAAKVAAIAGVASAAAVVDSHILAKRPVTRSSALADDMAGDGAMAHPEPPSRPPKVAALANLGERIERAARGFIDRLRPIVPA